ncbi:Universal stress protein family protein [Pseudooceanicola antarcticus]|uniref:Universal stress protein n=1 Tax=Pseudooceanicola antarcticus TaxID=1247613 RepID=A0A285I0H5_9RHOB|nr:universal stress protein [Pseudooceanicola antarcticus]PJE30274.1 universal stress protein [Pseudooceanicola antarcticus]SNY41482.1 Universal stress protein family protein [Pseudooceanicola antarcticus]
MAYKTIFTILTRSEGLKAQLDQVAALAQSHDAHLDVLCLGVDRTQMGYYYAGANAVIMQEAIGRATKEAAALEAQASDALKGTPIRYAVDTDVAQMGDLGRHVAWRARFSDLVVLPKPYGEGKGVEDEPIIESVLFEGRTPVMVLPETLGSPQAPAAPMIAWNETPEALAAVRKALPLLQKAGSAHVVIIDPPVHGPNRSDPGGMLATWLARHGVTAEIDVISKTLPRVSEVIRRHATDIGADMIIMGAYGHSRFREAILGGATRHMLEDTDLPIFMAH